jgi:hypothetical protein
VVAAQHNDSDLVIGSSISEEPNGTRFGSISYCANAGRRDLACGWLAGKAVQTGALLWRTRFITAIGLWNESVISGQDEEITIRAFLFGGKFCVCNEGSVIWCDHDDDNRISRRSDSLKLQCQFGWVEDLLELHLGIWGERQVTAAFGHRFYLIARRAFQVGCDEIAERSVKRASELGFRPKSDLSIASFARAVLGMRRKEQITHLLKETIKNCHWLWILISTVRSFRRQRIYQKKYVGGGRTR